MVPLNTPVTGMPAKARVTCWVPTSVIEASAPSRARSP
jgi:hypothetical protein